MVCQYCEAELTERAMDEGSCPECGASLMGSSLFDDEAVFEEEDDEFDEFDDEFDDDDEDDEELIDELDDIKNGMAYDDDDFEDDIFEDDDEFENEEAV